MLLGVQIVARGSLEDSVVSDEGVTMDSDAGSMETLKVWLVASSR